MVIYPNDHRPAHIHARNDAEAVFKLNCPAGHLTVRENYGFSRREIGRIEHEMLKQVEQLCSAWEKIHGND